MKILFSALHFGYFRNFESVIAALAERGHHVHLAADEPDIAGGQGLVERLAATHETVTWGWTPGVQDEPWFVAAQKARYGLDYVRFLHARYEDAPKLRLRNISRAARILRWLTAPIGGFRPGRQAVETGLKWAERMMPRSDAIRQWMEDQAPDVVLLATLTFSRSTNMEQLKAARVSGVPVAACIMSWDHLSSKSMLHIHPDLTLVWNETQQREAVEMHALPSNRVAITGAQCYDQWFARGPELSREAFCKTVGLSADRPFVLYVCSAMSPSPDPVEPVFVKRWAEALKASADPVLRETGILIRPHPERLKEWQGLSLEGLDNVVVRGRNPIDHAAKAEYFDSLYHSAAVAGICTSAFLEAAIVGRPVQTLLLPEFRIHQEGMAHFRYLMQIEDGLLEAAPTLDAHLRQLSAAIAAPAPRTERAARFLKAFVRPKGLDCPATPVFVEHVERLAAGGRRVPDPTLAGSTFARAFMERLAVSAHTRLGSWLLMDAIDEERAQSERESQRFKQEIEEKRLAYRRGKERKRDEAIRATEGERREKEWRKWRRGLSARKQVARLKGGVKQLIGARER
jgi:hypothetical protein